MESKVGNILLMGDDVFFQLEGLIMIIGDKKRVIICAVLYLAQSGNHFSFISVADVIFFTICQPATLFSWS
jgi:hypothetical protein